MRKFWVVLAAVLASGGALAADAVKKDQSILDVKAEKEIARVKVGTAPKRVLVIEVPQDQVTAN